MPKEITWTVRQRGDVQEREQIEYIPIARVGPKATDAEKESVRQWNLMQKTCLDYKLMKPKEGA